MKSMNVIVPSCEGYVSCFIHVSKKMYVEFHFAPEVKQFSKLTKWNHNGSIKFIIYQTVWANSTITMYKTYYTTFQKLTSFIFRWNYNLKSKMSTYSYDSSFSWRWKQFSFEVLYSMFYLEHLLDCQLILKIVVSPEDTSNLL
jgi:hypothetical protein